MWQPIEPCSKLSPGDVVGSTTTITLIFMALVLIRVTGPMIKERAEDLYSKQTSSPENGQLRHKLSWQRAKIMYLDHAGPTVPGLGGPQALRRRLITKKNWAWPLCPPVGKATLFSDSVLAILSSLSSSNSASASHIAETTGMCLSPAIQSCLFEPSRPLTSLLLRTRCPAFLYRMTIQCG